MFSSMTVFVRRGARASAGALALNERTRDEEEEGDGREERHDLRAREARDEAMVSSDKTRLNRTFGERFRGRHFGTGGCSATCANSARNRGFYFPFVSSIS